jgi:hypothetical protein
MSWRQEVIKLEEDWYKRRIEEPTHIAMGMSDYIRLRSEVAVEDGWDDEEMLLRPLYYYEGLQVVISENPNFDGPVLLSIGE